jgi:hypothetical protein
MAACQTPKIPDQEHKARTAFAVRASKIKRSQPSAAPTVTVQELPKAAIFLIYRVMGSLSVTTNVSNTFCPSRAACRTSRNVSSSRTFGLAGFRAGVVFMLAGMRD